MNVILLERVSNLGALGEEVTVKNGFARNFLIPTGKAVRASEESRRVFEERRVELEGAANEKFGEAEARAAGLDEMSITIVARAGEEGKLFGSVGTADIAQALADKGVEVSRNEVRMPEGVIRAIGEYEVDVQLHADVLRVVHVAVIPE